MSKSKIALFCLMFVLWPILTWNWDWQNLLAGALAAMFIAWLAGGVFTKNPYKFANPKRYFWFLCYFPVLFWAMLKAAFITLYRIVMPRNPGRSGVIIIKSSLRSESGLTFLAQALMLGGETVSIDIDPENGSLQLYCIDMHEGRNDGSIIRSAKTFEKILSKAFEK